MGALLVLLAALALLAAGRPADAAPKVVILSTTTSTQDSGLLDVLVPMFERQTGYTVKTVAVGPGRALALAARGEADVTLAHAPELEKKHVAEGKLFNRRLVMDNDFIIVGPPTDPAKIAGERSAVEALRRIAAAGARFVSPGDNSGTHLRQLRRRQVRPAPVRAHRREDRRGPRAMSPILDGLRQAAALLLSRDPEVWAILWLSLRVSGTATLVALLIGVPLGAILALARFAGRGLVVSLVNTGMGLAAVVLRLFVSILLWRSGPLGELELLYTPAAIVVAQAMISAPIVTRITPPSVQNMPEMFRLQLLALGASRTQMVWVVLREARLPMLAAVIAGFRWV